MKVEELLGKTIAAIYSNEITGEFKKGEVVYLETSDGKKYKMYHEQNCCENVRLEDVIGDVEDLLNSPLTMSELTTNSEDNKPSEYSESFTWSFYRFATVKGYVTLRWLGESNGWYSESVNFVEIDENGNEH